MPLTSAERLEYAITCPRCGKVTHKPIAWLVTFDSLPCVTPDCGNGIDLKTPDNRALINQLASQAASLDAFLAKRD